MPACLLKYKSINFKSRKNKIIMKYEKKIFKISKMLPFKPIPKELNKTLNIKPLISHIIRTKKTLDSLEAKNRTNIIARRPAKAKTLDSLEVKNRTNIARRPAKVKKLEAKNRTTIIASYIQLLNASSPDLRRLHVHNS